LEPTYGAFVDGALVIAGAFVIGGALVSGVDGAELVSSLLQPANAKPQTRANRTTSDNLVFIQRRRLSYSLRNANLI
jgi:hypothetical protein